MDKTFVSILETQGSKSLNIEDRRFSNEDIFEIFFDCCFFHKINFINCFFEDSECLGVNFNYCLFENCIFKNTIIRKSELTDCVFKKCQFLNCALSPRAEFYRTIFQNSQFFNTDFSFSTLSNCEFKMINFSQIVAYSTTISNPKVQKTTFNGLEFEEVRPMKILFSELDSFPKEI